jgi:hypothetical protein
MGIMGRLGDVVHSRDTYIDDDVLNPSAENQTQIQACDIRITLGVNDEIAYESREVCNVLEGARGLVIASETVGLEV